VLKNAVTVKIGRDGDEARSVNMYNNAAADTMMDYFSESERMFPTYTYDDMADLLHRISVEVTQEMTIFR